MTNQTVQAETSQAIAALVAIAQSKCVSFGDGYKQVGINFSIPACKAAAAITGADVTFCKMLNYDFRTAAARLMLARNVA